MKFTWKLLPLVALLAVGLFALGGAPGSTPQVAADIGTVTLGGSAVADGATITAADGDSSTLRVVMDASPGDGIASVEISSSSPDDGTAEFTFVSCDDDSGPAGDDCAVSGGNSSDDITVDDGPDTNGTSGLTRVDVTVDVSCNEDAAITVTIETTDAPGGAHDTHEFEIDCSLTGGVITSVVTTTSATSFACNSITGTVTVTVKDSGGDPIQGASVNLTATGSGTILETMPQTTSAAGTIVFHYYAPATAQSVEFGANADNDATAAAVAATPKTVAVTCAAAATATVPLPAPTTATGGTVRAPATGDGGLAGDNGANWTIYAALLLTLGGLAGGVAVAKRIRA
ncbi:MAG TPA: hypothetical protein VI759_10540 [Dehalococcoidia bacterium]|nr:hypothetical protein [Dehalococcoidia bacterium]